MDSQNLSRTFTHCELYFTEPGKFNDPFDCKPPFSINNYSENDLREHFKKAFLSICPEISNSKLETLVEKNAHAILNDHRLFQPKIIDPFVSTVSEVNATLGVLCLSEKPDDILMWSHYTNGHRGLVLQFDKLALENNGFDCKQVDYKNNTITLKDINQNLNIENALELANLILWKKSEHWDYEKEWRIVVDTSLRTDISNCRIYIFPKEALTGVILGCEMTPEDKYLVRMWLKEGGHRARIFNATKDTSTYSIKINPPLGDYSN